MILNKFWEFFGNILFVVSFEIGLTGLTMTGNFTGFRYLLNKKGN